VDQADVTEVIGQFVGEALTPVAQRCRLRCEWLARICSTSVEPERGRPTMKIGARLGSPASARPAKNAASKNARIRSQRRSNLSISNGASRRRSALPCA
jgi:hypothetical protein